eukprot:CAMPEP_0174698170 /NCGR_PEP_ID=MMETSP1094-20130205/3822_1 /TAXON_ID=156173 /ORGANISM="Chrysochromulina brevifilum, Strain UTEX LB 985" /LENGTH=40 /DNA_ID= /DNA_START= /DNA_END= /DNA_ORIENTATION=
MVAHCSLGGKMLRVARWNRTCANLIGVARNTGIMGLRRAK